MKMFLIYVGKRRQPCYRVDGATTIEHAEAIFKMREWPRLTQLVRIPSEKVVSEPFRTDQVELATATGTTPIRMEGGDLSRYLEAKKIKRQLTQLERLMPALVTHEWDMQGVGTIRVEYNPKSLEVDFVSEDELEVDGTNATVFVFPSLVVNYRATQIEMIDGGRTTRIPLAATVRVPIDAEDTLLLGEVEWREGLDEVQG
jgi:hypothetical protein